MSTTEPAPLASWLLEPLPADVAASVERLRRLPDVEHVALMPDVHLASDVCVGAVVATRELLYPAAVGSDIGCGMAALRFDVEASAAADERIAARILAGLYAGVPSNKHRSPQTLPEALAEQPLSSPRLSRVAQRDGRVQFGTLGRGNHFLELQADATGALWATVHSGSRGVGQAISQHWMNGGGRPSAPLPACEAGGPDGQALLADVDWARRYAAESRLAMLRAMAELLEKLLAAAPDWTSLIHTDHDHLQREEHFGRRLWVHRKGAQQLPAGAIGIVPGSMGASTFHVSGRGCVDALDSCSHGAGRKLSRGAARARISARQLQQQMRGVWFDQRRVEQLRDEAPAAYKDVQRVMRAQRPLVRIVRELKPLLTYKGG